MNGEQPLPLPKKVKGSAASAGPRTAPGASRGGRLSARPTSPQPRYRRADVGADDLIDACACAWSARRIAEGRAVSFPADPPRDARGLRMAITA